MYDALIVGAGPAGLSAALVLGRCRRRVLVCDAGAPRNAASHALHGFLTRDGVAPGDFLRLAREEVAAYAVEIEPTDVTAAVRTEDGFELNLANGARPRGRVLLLATGIVDVLPDVDGFEPLWGRSVFVCPYCDGWEVADRPLGAWARGGQAPEFAVGLTAWSRDIVLFTDGERLAPPERDRVAAAGILVRDEPVVRLESAGGRLTGVRLRSGDVVARAALFISLGQRQRSDLALRLGAKLDGQGGVQTGFCESTDVPGLFVAGDATRDVQLAIVAAAEGAQAAFAMHKMLGVR